MRARDRTERRADRQPGAASASRWSALRDVFRERFPGEPRAYRAPGRVNLIGEHTDYNDGFVLPAAIDLDALVLAAPGADRTVRILATSHDELASFLLDDADPGPPTHWSTYPRGVAIVLERAGRRLPGADILVHGEIPQGGGLGSSAALEVATAWALLDLAGETPDAWEVARACQQAENEFAGTRCGIMDQLASCLGREGHALLLDCRSLETRAVPLPGGIALLVCHSGVRHALASGAYNRRRAECEQAVRILSGVRPGIASLRDVTADDLERHARLLPDPLLRRSRHVVSETRRVLEAATALERSDLGAFGPLLAASHASLRDDYEVSCAELDTLVEAATDVPGVIGSRMTGGGFGGCTVTLVRSSSAEAAAEQIAARFDARYGRRPWTRVCAAAGGAERLR